MLIHSRMIDLPEETLKELSTMNCVGERTHDGHVADRTINKDIFNPKSLRYYKNRDNLYCIIKKVGTCIVGWINYVPNYVRKSTVNIYVKPSFRCMGFGRMLAKEYLRINQNCDDVIKELKQFKPVMLKIAGRC